MHQSTIAVSFKRPADRRLVKEFLSSLEHKAVDLSEVHLPDLVLVDSKHAKEKGKDFFKQLKDRDPGFLPVLVAIDSGEKPDNWLGSGVVDDCLRLPLTKSELENRINVFLRIRRQALAIKGRDVEIRAIVDSSEDHIFMLNEKGQFVSSNGRIKYMGLEDRGSLLGKELNRVFPPDIAELFFKEIEQTLIHCSSRSFDFTLTNQGKKLHCHVTLFPVHLPDGRERVGGICRDITKLVQSETERHLLAAAMEQTAEGIVITDSHQHIVMVNKGFVKMSGYNRQELLGRRPDFFWKKAPKLLLSRLVDLTSREVKREDVVAVRKDGSEFVVETTIAPVADQKEEAFYFVILYRDVTEERQFEKRKEQIRRLEAIGTLAGGIAHDFNNILTPVMGYAELCRNSVEPGSKLEAYIDQIIFASNRARELVQQILTFSRQAKREKVPLNIYSVVKEALKLIRAALPADIKINQQIDKINKYVLADPTEIHQIIMNLCTNAWHAMSERGGVLSCSLSEIEITGQNVRSPQELAPGTYVRFSVEDTGHGIAPEIMDRIFEPYFTTKEADKGTGLGLATVHGIVTDYGGCISVDSKVGKGTVFRVYLPVYTREQETGEAQEHQYTTGSGERILFVDDEPTIVEVVKSLLEKRGYRVSSFHEPKSALRSFEQSPDAFDIVITDMTMPGMNGLSFANEIRQVSVTIPIIICTGFSERIDSSKIQELGVAALVKKPFTGLELARVVGTALSGRQ